jgi:hypothetical protein
MIPAATEGLTVHQADQRQAVASRECELIGDFNPEIVRGVRPDEEQHVRDPRLEVGRIAGLVTVDAIADLPVLEDVRGLVQVFETPAHTVGEGPGDAVRLGSVVGHQASKPLSGERDVHPGAAPEA